MNKLLYSTVGFSAMNKLLYTCSSVGFSAMLFKLKPYHADTLNTYQLFFSLSRFVADRKKTFSQKVHLDKKGINQDTLPSCLVKK